MVVVVVVVLEVVLVVVVVVKVTLNTDDQAVQSVCEDVTSDDSQPYLALVR